MVTIDTKNNDIYAEVFEEYEKAIYWFKKAIGGEKKWEKLRDALLAKSLSEKKDFVSDVVEYKGPHGNRWRIFESCRYYPESKGAHTDTLAFMYYETMASCGAIFPIFNGIGENCMKGVLIYTDHFFYRMCQRMGIEYRSSKMIQQFLEMVPMQIVNFTDSFYGDKRRINVGLPGSQGRGVARSMEPLILEVRTFYLNSELTKKQERETKWLRKVQKQVKYEPLDMAKGRLLNKPLNEEIRDEIKKMKTLGYSDSVAKGIMSMGIMLGETLLMHGSGQREAETTLGKLSNEIQQAVVRCVNHSELKWVNSFYELTVLLKMSMKMTGSKKKLGEVANTAYREFYQKEKDTDYRDWFDAHIDDTICLYEMKIREFNDERFRRAK